MLVRKRTFAFAAVALFILNGFVCRAALVPPSLTFSVLPVSKGEAVLLHTPDGRTYLINAGADASVLRSLGSALPFWQRRLDALILTDATAGDVGGAQSVLARYRVGEILRSGNQGSASLETAVAHARTKSAALVRGERLLLGGGAYADVLSPPAESPAHPLILRIGYDAQSVLVGSGGAGMADWERQADGTLPAPDLVIASTTAPGTYAFDGRRALRGK
ncbi:MAG TPA: hypothetical protein VMT80_02235 [Candidatus Paceibacterota bacterium]|nr:hypothetical protein [Candidatus Paceibacterota bacterium]